MLLKRVPQVMVEKLYLELELNEQLVIEAVNKLKEWLYLQPHLPQITDDERLKRIFLQCKGRMEIAKSVVDTYYSVRTHIPEVLSNRDPFSKWFKDLTNRIMVVTLPEYTEEFHRVTIISAIHPPPDIQNFDLLEILKLVCMVQDIRLAEDMALGDVVLIDVQKGTVAHAAKFTLPFFEKVKFLLMKAFKTKIKALHILNASPFMDAVIAAVKTLIKEEYKTKLVVHSEGYIKGYDSLHAHIPQKYLPKEYGGDAGPIIDMWDEWKKKICSHRDWFLNEGAMRSDEKKRPGKSIDTIKMFGFEGSFRQLVVD